MLAADENSPASDLFYLSVDHRRHAVSTRIAPGSKYLPKTRDLMKSKISRRATVLAASALAVASSLVLNTPAQALGGCGSEQHREFGTSGYNTDVYIQMCVTRERSNPDKFWASAEGYWIDGGGARKFDNFDIKVRLERNDSAILTATCDYTAEINGASSGTIQCKTGSHYTTSQTGLSGDGWVNFDLDADGLGGDTWELTGSPRF
ncbi:hypothetical protein QQM39_22340 [Streptomyces sp. DT2A-34]|uniref:hypothetical protein n=1 Tax=Streptomyces sp. DT2A-34 TaxID=3051182 RepID=UPI00265C6400|nr:hypothetical protein [Streptomyces sp. DT2A-34]MDO0913483.1 hypothetical protein [Streptomyces sp. DT2A-34]